MHTIAAISTPNAVGGIAVIRISGSNAFGVAERIFKPFNNKKISDMEGYTCCYGIAHDNNERIDDCILTVFKAPHSYTGENVVEISCHGGLFISKKILRTALRNGAENAEAGEFTKRAFMNGKLDLTQAEAVMGIISAKSDMELKIAEELREGAAFKKARNCSDKLVKILGDLAAWADYPEEDIPEVEPNQLAEELKTVRNELFSLVENYDAGRIIREGISTVIVGKPNVGKSTLFNCLAGCERSIVTDISGTTRDVVEESVRIGDIILRLSDTAGIHETQDIIEGIGIGIAEKMIDSSELVIAVFDGSCPCTEDDLKLIDRIKNKKSLAVINKSDAEQVFDSEMIKSKNIPIVYISAKENNIEQLNIAVQNLFKINSEIFSSVPAANERQKRCIEKALESVDSAVNMLKNGEFLDAVTVVIDEAEQYLLELTGEKITETVVNEVFSRFCVGK